MGRRATTSRLGFFHTGEDLSNNPKLNTANNFLTTALTHIVHTYDGTTERLYVNGVQNPTTVAQAGNFSNWDANDLFNIGNEGSSDRPWLGTVRMAAIYDRSLTQAEIQQNFTAGN